MSKLIVTEFVTLDGVMEAPGGEPTHPHSGWVIDYFSDEQMKFKLDEVLAAESLLLGRVTYESFAEAWPARADEFADKMNQMPKFVASTTLTDLEWENSTLLGEDVPGAVARLEERDGGPVLVAGSRTLVQHAAPPRPGRRVGAHGLPRRPRERSPPVPGRLRRQDPAAPDRHAELQLGRRGQHLRAGLTLSAQICVESQVLGFEAVTAK